MTDFCSWLVCFQL